MALTYHLSSIAEREIAQIVEYIARDNLDAALKLVDRFTHAFELLSANPELGERYKHPDLHLRQFVVEKYLVTYQVAADQIIIVRVIHGAQLFDEKH